MVRSSFCLLVCLQHNTTLFDCDACSDACDKARTIQKRQNYCLLLPEAQFGNREHWCTANTTQKETAAKNRQTKNEQSLLGAGASDAKLRIEHGGKAAISYGRPAHGATTTSAATFHISACKQPRAKYRVFLRSSRPYPLVL